jgi:hypothetical protein
MIGEGGMTKKTSKRIHQMTIPQWEAALPDEGACVVYLIRHRGPVGIFCPRCGVSADHSVKTMPNKWQSCAAASPVIASRTSLLLVAGEARHGRHFHKVSKKYLPLCVAEFALRYNRSNDNVFAEVIRGC